MNKFLPLLLISAVTLQAASPLDQPAPIEASTIRTEIARGYNMVTKEAGSRFRRSNQKLNAIIPELRQLSEGVTWNSAYLLGARLGELQVIDFLLLQSDVASLNDVEEIRLAGVIARNVRSEIRTRCQELSLSNEALMSAAGAYLLDVLNRYDSGAAASLDNSQTTSNSGRTTVADAQPLPEFSPLAAPEFICLTKDFVLVNAKGIAGKSLPKGKRLRVLERSEKNIAVDYFGERFLIPADITESAK